MLVLAPTRELAAQIAQSCRDYGRFTKLSVSTVFGGDVETDQSSNRAKMQLAAFSQQQELAADKEGIQIAGDARVKADAQAATQGSLSWRTKDQPDFLPANLVRFSIPAGTSEQTIALPVDGQAIHVRFNLDDAAEGLRLRSIELRPAKGTPDRSDFSR